MVCANNWSLDCCPKLPLDARLRRWMCASNLEEFHAALGTRIGSDTGEAAGRGRSSRVNTLRLQASDLCLSCRRAFCGPPSFIPLGSFSVLEPFPFFHLNSPSSISPTMNAINVVSLDCIISLSMDMPMLDLARLTQNVLQSHLWLSLLNLGTVSPYPCHHCNAVNLFTDLILMTFLWHRHCHHPSFTNRKTRAEHKVWCSNFCCW